MVPPEQNFRPLLAPILFFLSAKVELVSAAANSTLDILISLPCKLSAKFLKETTTEDKLNYQLFSDSDGKFSQALGIAFKRDKPKLEKYSEGKNPGFLPVPTVYVLNENREIEFMYINPNYSKRLKGDLLLSVLKNL